MGYQPVLALSVLIHFMDLARQVIQACEAKGVHGFKVAFRISGL